VKKTNKYESGLGVVELLFGIVILSALGFGGWFVYKNQINPNTTTTQDTSSTLTAPVQNIQSTSNNKNVIKFSEISVQITVLDSISDLNYKVFTYNGTHAVIHTDVGKAVSSIALNLSTDNLATNNQNCSPANAPLGRIIKVTGTYPKDPNSNNSGGILIKQFNGYYISYAGNNSNVCPSLPQTKSLENSLNSLALTN